MISKEFYKQLESLAEEKKVDLEQIVEAIKKGISNAYKRENNNVVVPIRCEIKPEKHEISFYTQHIVVEEITDDPDNEMAQITLEDAKKISNKYHIGDIVEQAINPKEFGRIAASTAKQVFNQSLRGIEKGKIYSYFKKQENEMISGNVVAIDDKFITLSIGMETTTLLPIREILPNDNFEVGDRVKVYIVQVEDGTKGPKIYVSRSDKNLVTRLMEQIIPEIGEGIIEIKGIARDAGDRTKIAIYSTDQNVDAIGSCVGANGTRIKEVVQALNGEKIDLYLYSDEPSVLIANSLQPAQVLGVINVNPKEKTSCAIVPDDQLSLAIGKQGQNVRLAVQSCGWKIDIKPASVAQKEGLKY